MPKPTTLYLIRHAQSHQSARTHHSQWPLSLIGQRQAQKLATTLRSLGIIRVYSSPYLRCLQTLDPFLKDSNLPAIEHADLREQLLSMSLGDSDSWRNAWADFHFRRPDCESALAARTRFLQALEEICARHPGETLAIGTHGMVIALLLNHLDPGFGREQAEMISNPSVIRLIHDGKSFEWERAFTLPALSEFATHHDSTPVDPGD